MTSNHLGRHLSPEREKENKLMKASDRVSSSFRTFFRKKPSRMNLKPPDCLSSSVIVSSSTAQGDNIMMPTPGSSLVVMSQSITGSPPLSSVPKKDRKSEKEHDNLSSETKSSSKEKDSKPDEKGKQKESAIAKSIRVIKRTTTDYKIKKSKDRPAQDPSYLGGTMEQVDWQELLAGLKPISFSAGSIIVSQFSTNQKIFRIHKGTCLVTQITLTKDKDKLNQILNPNQDQHDDMSEVFPGCNWHADSTDVFTRVLREGDVFGEISFMSQSPATATVAVSRDAEALIFVIDKSHVEKQIKNRLALGGKLYKHLSYLMLMRCKKVSQQT
eukprot:TRINITY_DN823_c0_g1_i1.p1 TRINITY_DN823_c0_g1~~TRINITY_DN823_c0_g1_i1.p1  ORF type:complete len:328 (+),score=100.42 TRINITY_DN823_c0_g1_i1:158-1141(+)